MPLPPPLYDALLRPKPLAPVRLPPPSQGYVPPFTPLSVLGWLVGTLRLLLHLLRRPDPVKRRKAWVRKRARDVANFLRLWPTRANRNLLRKWKRLRKDVVRNLDPTTLLRLLLNACCPDVWGLRARVARWTGFKLSSLPGCQVRVLMGRRRPAAVPMIKRLDWLLGLMMRGGRCR